jgi:pimeloyl-ACP methyl ester carboxylesterase
MPLLTRPDGVDLHWDERGEGATVLMVPYWSGHPAVFEGLLSHLARDHRVAWYDARGTGESSPRGPYDMETDEADLTALLEELGNGAVLVPTGDAANRAVRVAARRPELARAVVTPGGNPLGRAAFAGSEGYAGSGPVARAQIADGDSLIASDTVVDAFGEMLARDYRGALRTVLTATNEQMTEEELRERVSVQTSYCPQEAAVARVRAWADDDPLEAATRLGDRLWILTAPGAAGPWLPPLEETRRMVEEQMPEARLIVLEREEGAVSRPDLTANLVRQITAQLRAAR